MKHTRTGRRSIHSRQGKNTKQDTQQRLTVNATCMCAGVHLPARHFGSFTNCYMYRTMLSMSVSWYNVVMAPSKCHHKVARCQ